MKGNWMMIECHTGWEYDYVTHLVMIIKFPIRPLSIDVFPFYSDGHKDWDDLNIASMRCLPCSMQA